MNPLTAAPPGSALVRTAALALLPAMLAVSLAGCAAPKDDAPRRQPQSAPIGALFAPPGATAPQPGLSGRLEDPFHRDGPRVVHLLEYTEENAALVADLDRSPPLDAGRVQGPLRTAHVDAEGDFSLGEVGPGVWGLAWPCASAAPAEGSRGHWIFTRFEAEGGAERVVLKCLQPQ